MDPIPPPQQPIGIKEKVQETSREFMKDHSEGILRSLVNMMFAVLKFLKSSITQILAQLFNKN